MHRFTPSDIMTKFDLLLKTMVSVFRALCNSSIWFFSDSNFTSGIHWRGMNVKIYQIKQESSDKFISQKIMFIQLSMKLDKSCDNECKKGPQTE